jgi:hypothetical protein
VTLVTEHPTRAQTRQPASGGLRAPLARSYSSRRRTNGPRARCLWLPRRRSQSGSRGGRRLAPRVSPAFGGLAVRSWRNASSMTTSTRLTAKLTAVPTGRTPPTSGQPAPEPTPPGTGRRPARQPRQLQAVSILSRVKPGPPDPRCPNPARPRSPGTVPASPSTPAPPPLPAPPGNQPGNQEHHRLNHVRRMPPGTDKAGRNVSTAA